jgi:hypothetical protein
VPAGSVVARDLRGWGTLERTDNAMTIRPGPRYTWENIFASKLHLGSGPPGENPTDVDVTGEDFLSYRPCRAASPAFPGRGEAPPAGASGEGASTFGLAFLCRGFPMLSSASPS